MTPGQIDLVRESFDRLPLVPVAAVFYDRLFALDPSLRPLFKSDMHVQGARLMDMIGAIVRGLDQRERLTPALGELGVRHVAYGVKPEHYDTVGDALFWTLGQALGNAFTPEVEAAWREVYDYLSGAMKDAAYRTSG